MSDPMAATKMRTIAEDVDSFSALMERSMAARRTLKELMLEGAAAIERVADMTRVLEAARSLSTAMVDAEVEGGDFELVDTEWQALTEAIVACDDALASSDSK